MDRFFMRLSLGYMERSQEMQVIARRSTLDIIASLEQRVSAEETAYVRSAFTEVKVGDPVLSYIMDIIEATRRESRFVAGVSTRGAMAFYKAAQVTAAISGRDYVIPEDMKTVAVPVLGHRLSMGGAASAREAGRFLNKILEQITVPLE